MVFQTKGEILSLKEGSFTDQNGKTLPFYQAMIMIQGEVFKVSVPSNRVEDVKENLRKEAMIDFELIENYGKLRLKLQ